MQADRAGMPDGAIDPLVAGWSGLPGSERAPSEASRRTRRPAEALAWVRPLVDATVRPDTRTGRQAASGQR
jgi:hypothetical protein